MSEDIPKAELIATPAEMGPMLSQMRGLDLPEPIGWWPLAPGWWILIVLSLLFAIYVAHQIVRYLRTPLTSGLAGQAQHLIEANYVRWREDGNAHRYLAEANAVLRRLVLTTEAHQFSNESKPISAALTGKAWHHKLSQFSDHHLDQNSLHALTDLAYRPQAEVNIAAIHADLSQWAQQVKVLGSTR